MYDQPKFANPRRGLLTAVYAVLSGLLLVLLAVTAAAGLPGPTTAILASSQTLLLMALMLQLYLAHGYVKLTPQGIVVREIRLRTLPWRDVAGIRTRRLRANTVVEVVMADGRRRNLVAPVMLREKDAPRFFAEAARIQHWWAYWRGRGPG
ncbi:hypothetical protein [Streptomonospora arabica]|uniref:PH domain-containing protein n=1 Tax=Streptomonospora arabica TaxID=412417 RepID=A0ABV9SLX8_9ACTN